MKKQSMQYIVGIGVSSLVLMAACKRTDRPTQGQGPATVDSAGQQTYSAFGGYAPLPEWSGWCGLQANEEACVVPLKKAVSAFTIPCAILPSAFHNRPAQAPRAREPLRCHPQRS